MRRLILPLIGITALALAGPPAAAQSVGTPQVYVGVHGGKIFQDTTVSDPASSIDLGSQGWAGGVHGGLDVPFAKSSGMVPFAGAFLGYDWSDVTFTEKANGVAVMGSFGGAWYAGGRLGVMTSNGSKYYVLGEYKDGSLDLGQFKFTNATGWAGGVGAEFPVTHYVTLGLEGLYTKYDEQTAGLEKVSPKELGVMARLNFALGEPSVPTSIFSEPPPEATGGCDPKLGNCPRRR